jgi:hypothetical protein
MKEHRAVLGMYIFDGTQLFSTRYHRIVAPNSKPSLYVMLKLPAACLTYRPTVQYLVSTAQTSLDEKYRIVNVCAT